VIDAKIVCKIRGTEYLFIIQFLNLFWTLSQQKVSVACFFHLQTIENSFLNQYLI